MYVLILAIMHFSFIKLILLTLNIMHLLEVESGLRNAYDSRNKIRFPPPFDEYDICFAFSFLGMIK